MKKVLCIFPLAFLACFVSVHAVEGRSVPSLLSSRRLSPTTISKQVCRVHNAFLKYSKVLFIMPSMPVGGIERAFADTIQKLPLPSTQFDVCLLNRGLPFEKELKSDTHLISFEEACQNRYAAVVSFHHALPLSRWIFQIKAKRRLQVIHTDLNGWGKDWLFKSAKQRKKISAFIAVSQRAAKSFKKFYPKDVKKLHTIYNVIDSDRITTLSARLAEGILASPSLSVVSVCRISGEKALDRAIRIHKKLDNNGFHFKWYVVGGGDDILRKQLETMVVANGLVGKFIFLGEKTNPYPYIKRADIFAFLSYFEGWGVVTTEAKILHRPIIVTDVGGAREQIRSETNGLIVANNDDAIYKGMKRLLQDGTLRQKFTTALEGYTYDNAKILKKLMGLCFAREKKLRDHKETAMSASPHNNP